MMGASVGIARWGKGLTCKAGNKKIPGAYMDRFTFVRDRKTLPGSKELVEPGKNTPGVSAQQLKLVQLLEDTSTATGRHDFMSGCRLHSSLHIASYLKSSM